jgi:serine protease Do
VITEYAGKPAETVQQLRSFVAATAPGTEVPLAVTRDGDQQTISLTIGEQPETLQMARSGGSGRGFGRGQASTNVEKLGLRLSTLSPELAERYELTGVADAGAVITAVAPGSSAAAQGLRPGDTITRIGKQSVSSAEEAAKILSEADLAAGVTLRVVNSESSRIVALTLEP